VVVDPGPDDGKGVIHIGQSEKGLALDVGVGDIYGIQGWGVIVEYAEEVVVVAQEVGVCWREWGGSRLKGEVGHRAEERGRARGWLVAHRRWGERVEEGGCWRGGLEEHGNVVVVSSLIQLIAPALFLRCGAGASLALRAIPVLTYAGELFAGLGGRAGPFLTGAGLEEAGALGQD